MIARKAIWKCGNRWLPITIVGVLGLYDNKIYLKIEGSNTGIPLNEVAFLDDKEKDNV